MWAEAVLESIGIRVVESAYIGEYQGDWIALVVDDGNGYYSQTKGGFVGVGFGSCSGCDAWEAAETVEDRMELVDQMVRSIRWVDSPAALRSYLTSEDRQLSIYPNEDISSWQEFVQSAVNQLSTGSWHDVLAQHRRTQIITAAPLSDSSIPAEIRHLEEDH